MAAMALAAALPVSAQYQFYLTDHLTSVDSTKWATSGAVAASSGGLTAANAAGGSLISKVPIPDGSSEAEIDMTLALKSSGGSYTEFLQASTDARTAAATGNYLAFEMQNPIVNPVTKSCSATFVLLQGVGGSINAIAGFEHSCADGMVMKMAVHGGTVLLWPNQPTPMEFQIAANGAGAPGIGAYGTPAGNGISLVQLGAIGRATPVAVNQQKLTASVFRKRVELHWPAVAASAVSPGIASYWIYRDGAYLGRTTGVNFWDESVAIGATYNYSLVAVDQHFNASAGATLSVTVPSAAVVTPAPNLKIVGVTKAPPALPHAMERPEAASGTPGGNSGNGMDPRRVGVRPAGGYWGGGGENIDAASANLNFTLPLIKPQARGGWSVKLALSYNSQLWRRDASGTYVLGNGVMGDVT